LKKQIKKILKALGWGIIAFWCPQWALWQIERETYIKMFSADILKEIEDELKKWRLLE